MYFNCLLCSEDSVPQYGLLDDLAEGEFNPLYEVRLVVGSSPVHAGGLTQQLKRKKVVRVWSNFQY